MRVRLWFTLVSAMLFGVPAKAAVGPVVGQAGHGCPIELCGDVVSAPAGNGGFPSPIFVEPPGSPPAPAREFKPHVYFVEVPANPDDPSQPVPFIFSFFDIGARGAYDTCFSNDPDFNKSVQFNPEGIAQGCDTSTVIRIYPPAHSPCWSATGPSPQIAQFEYEANPEAGDTYFNCGDFDWICEDPAEPDCCARLDGRLVEIGWEQLFDKTNPRINDACRVPGTWQVEVDTSEASSFSVAYDDPGRNRRSGAPVFQDDVDVYRFAAYQAPSVDGTANPLCSDRSGQFALRVWSPFVSATPPVRMTGDGRELFSSEDTVPVRPVLYPDVSGGWLIEADIATSALDPTQQFARDTGETGNYKLGDGFVFPIASFQAPNGQAFDTTRDNLYTAQGLLQYLGIQTGDKTGPPDVRFRIPNTFLGDGFVTVGGVSGYPIRVSSANSQGLWRLGFDLRVVSPKDGAAKDFFPTIITGTSSETGFPINRVAMVNLRRSNSVANSSTSLEYPSLFNTWPLYFASPNVPSPCGGPGFPEGEQNLPIDSGNPDDGDFYQQSLPKPAFRQTARLFPDVVPDAPNSREDNDTANQPWLCYEVSFELQNPKNSPASLPQVPGGNDAQDPITGQRFGITINVPGTNQQPNVGGQVNNVRLLGISDCTGVSGPGCADPVDFVDCDNIAWRTRSGANRTSTFDALPIGDGLYSVAELPPDGFARVRYIVVASLRAQAANDEPAFLTGVGANGSTALWQNEVIPPGTSPRTTDAEDDPFFYFGPDQRMRLETRFGPPAGSGGGSGGSGGTAPSTGDSDVGGSLATIASVRVLSDGRGQMLEFTTAFEHQTAGFRALDPDSGAALTGFIPTRPHRIGGTYRVPLGDTAPEAVTVVEYELAGAQRRHGPLPLAVESVSALPEPANYGDDGTGGIPLRTATAVERFTPLTGRARFTIGETGIYRLSYSAIASSTVLSAAEAAMRANEGQLRITSQGRAVPYRPDIDGVVFFADATVDEQVFGTPFVIEIGNGVRVSSLERSNPVQAPLQSFTERVLFEEDLRAAPATQSDSDDVWMWRFLLANPTESEQTSFDFDAPDITSGDAEIELRIRGGSQTVYKDHEVVVTVNGEEVHRTLFFGFDDRRETFRVPDGVLRTTGNEMTVQAIGRPDVPFSVVWVDSFELRYPRAFLAGDRERVFETAGGRVLLEGFDTPELEVWRLGRSNHDQIANPVITEEGGTYSVSFGSGSLAARYVAFTPDRARTVDALTPIGPGTGLEPGFGGVEYVVIAHPSLREGAEQLAEYRSSQGISSLVIDVFDIYDQFSDGLPRAEALGAFVRSTVSDWWIKPRYIVLVGDGSYDSRDVLAAADNLITPPLIDSPDGRFASELSLGEIFREPGYEVAVGRIPAQTPEDLAHYIAKVQVFEAAQGAVSTDAFILADNDDEAGPFSESLALAVDAFNRGAFSVDEHLVDPMDLDTARDRLFGAIESGTRYVNYIGHGSLGALSGEGVLRREDVDTLGNSESPFVLLAASCLLGRFEVPGVRTLADTLLFAEGNGAAAVFASAGVSQNEESTALSRLIAVALTERQQRRLGAIIARASALATLEGVSPDTLAIHTVLGDPALLVTPIADEWQPLIDAPVASQPVAEGSEPFRPTDLPRASPAEPEAPSAEATTDSPSSEPRFAAGCAAIGGSFWVALAALVLLRRRRAR